MGEVRLQQHGAVYGGVIALDKEPLIPLDAPGGRSIFIDVESNLGTGLPASARVSRRSLCDPGQIRSRQGSARDDREALRIERLRILRRPRQVRWRRRTRSTTARRKCRTLAPRPITP